MAKIKLHPPSSSAKEKTWTKSFNEKTPNVL